MKKRTLVTGLLVLLPVCSALAKPQLTGCAAKEHDIKQQIEQAHKHNNPHRADGLHKALREVREHCTDESLRRERLSDVHEKEHEVTQRLRDLDEAKQSGNPEKIEKRKKKLKEARQELAEAKAELSK
ncbi:DUF1090 domain-containing protein [Vibrio ostreae]|uniref:DUF1090 domain-containing protein n=1 Tax=Vibrio ostreae TaxID=2841925 RepID=A0A975YLU4_9VIBR|nr:DUF1090 domain-containing protein [Vibrio ostreae]QXO16023.1 DUF1090 domain-containing protein [Vibrio ostreae]